MIGLLTVPSGQRIGLWSHAGELRFVDGPRRLWLWRERPERLTHFVARDGEYLVIRYRDGRVEQRAGPSAEWRHPVEHESIEVASATPISAHEAVVVYRREDAVVERRVVRGPASFVPRSGEWLHEFSWHGSDPKHPAHKLPHALEFTKLRVIPDQMYVDVEAVRTADDALIAVRCMLFFELADIETMLARTHDPIADLCNALTADVIEFAAARNFEQFKADTEKLNQLATFAQLSTRAGSIGYRATKVVYRGFTANPELQAMHESAIQARTRLRLEADTEAQAQGLADMKLERETQRSAQRHAMERAEIEHRAGLRRSALGERLARERTSSDMHREQRQRDHEQRVRERGELDALRLRYATSLRDAGVDLTRWLVARYRQPDRLIRIEGNTANVRLPIHEG